MTDPNSRLGLLVAGYEKALQDLLTQIITYWQARRTSGCSPFYCCVPPLLLQPSTLAVARHPPNDQQAQRCAQAGVYVYKVDYQDCLDVILCTTNKCTSVPVCLIMQVKAAERAACFGQGPWLKHATAFTWQCS